MRDSPENNQKRVNGWIHLFFYIREVSKEIGEEKALEILSEIQTQRVKKWFEENASTLDLSNLPLLTAYRLMMEDMIGDRLFEINIVEQSEDRIVHHYDLPCSILDACLKLGLDTRKICKALHQKSANTILQLVDPNLRFDRDNEKIHPYTDHCVEIFWVEK